MVVIAMIAFTTAVVAGYGRWSSATTTSRNVNAARLAEAKSALIGYIVKEVLDLSENVPGRLPCPESTGTAGTTSEGIAAANCAPTYPNNKSIGRLPWRTLGIDKLVDADSEPLWYAVSPNWVLLAASSPVINVGTTGQLSFDGVPDVVAVIFAPGRAISTTPTAAQNVAGCTARNQVRTDRTHIPTGGDPDYRDYLECQNADTASIDTTFGIAVADNESNLAINDQAIIITSKDVLNAIQGPLAERLQRTVAPLLNEYSKNWIASGTILPTPANTTLARFMPYAFPFAAPESATPVASLCGSTSSPVREGLLPLAPMALTAPCETPWQNFTWTGSVDVTGSGCTADVTGAVTCQFRYYTLRSITFPVIGTLNLFQILGLASPATIDVTLDAAAPYAASTFRQSLAAADFTLNPTAKISAGSFTQTPSAANGGANLRVNLSIADGSLCVDTPPPATAPTLNIVCRTLGTFGDVCALITATAPLCGGLGAILTEALTTPNTVTVQFPALSNPKVQGTQLSATVMSGVTTPIDLLNPGTSAPHYWFARNEWYRYTYYALAPGTSAAQTGGNFTINQFPYGTNSDKRFVLTLMGPAVTGQTRSSTSPFSPLSSYLEGDNAATGASPRVFAYQVFSAPGNDRMATCPFTSGSSICD